MQARLEVKRFPSMLFVVLFALAVTLLLGGALGYALKPATQVSGPTHVVVLPGTQPGPGYIGEDSCQFVGHHKQC
ncbi:MAG TPA: hypothetical protein VLR46_10015 [Candidatus Dormibacteraeota bacterium]|nr:hypothetical protein [Candidatus Dormibacteraeota bacterium]